MLRKVFAGGWSAAAAVAGMLSPGNGFGAMNAGENVDIDDLIAATKVVAQFLYDVLVAPAKNPRELA